MLNRVQTFSRWLFLVLASLVLAACGSGDGDDVLPGNGVSNYQLTLNGATSVGASGSITLTATLLDPAGIAVPNATINFVQTGAGSLAATSATTDATGVATVNVNGTTTSSGSGTVIARYTDPRNNIAQDPHTYTVSSGDQVILTLSKTQVKSGVGDSVTITARVTGSDGAFVSGRQVQFSVSGNGFIQVTDPVTDLSGAAKAVFTPGDIDFSNRIVEIIAKPVSATSSIEGRATLAVTGTAITLTSSASQITLGEAVTIKAKAVDGNGNNIQNAAIRISSSNNNFVATTLQTNSQGEASLPVTVSVAVGGNETISAASTTPPLTSGALNVSASPITIAVTGTRFEFSSPTPAAELKTGTTLNENAPAADATPPPATPNTITVRWLEGAAPQTGRNVRFVATRGSILENSGTINDGIVTLDGAGEGRIVIESNTAGSIVVEARTIPTAPGEAALQISRSFEFIASLPSQVAVQVAQNVLSPGQQTVVSATVRDALNNPVKNRVIEFTLPTDPSNGGFDIASAITGSDGIASATYTAGPSNSSTDGVTIRATDQGTGLFSSTQLTVGGGASFITLGTGNTIREVDSTTYGLPYTVLLTNSAGQPIANASVTLSITPLRYFKGVYVEGAATWVPAISASCINEDADLDGILDPNENDRDASTPLDNGDGVLWPGNVITVSAGTVTTNSSGFANFEVRYSQQYGNWVEVALKASRNVAGSESVNTAVFVPPISSDDAKLTQAPLAAPTLAPLAARTAEASTACPLTESSAANKSPR